MKFGCILKLITIIIVILGTSLYLYDRYGKNLIADRSQKVKEIVINKIDSLVEAFEKKEIEAPLKDKFTEMLDDVKTREDEFTDKNFEEIISNFNKIIEEKSLNDTTLENLKKNIEVKIKHL